MNTLKQLLESLSKVPKAMQIPIGIGIAIGIFFWSGGDRLFDSIDYASSLKCQKEISIIKDSLTTEKWLTIRKLREKHRKEIDSLTQIIKDLQ